MSLSSFVERFGRAILTVTVLLAIAGLLSAFSLPSDIYPPLIFPRDRGHRSQRHPARRGR